MKKLNYLLLFTAFFVGNSFVSLSQENNNSSYDHIKNHLRIGINYSMNGTWNEVTLMYQNEYQRKLNKYLELGLGLGFSNYISEFIVNDPFNSGYVPDKAFNSTSIVSFDLMINLLVINFEKHFFKVGTGYSLRKVKRIKWRTINYTQDISGNKVALINYEKTDGFDGGLILGIEYGYRITPHFSTSVSGRYYSEGKYVSLAITGINFYYSF
jgi:hypothetical protein